MASMEIVNMRFSRARETNFAELAWAEAIMLFDVIGLSRGLYLEAGEGQFEFSTAVARQWYHDTASAAGDRGPDIILGCRLELGQCYQCLNIKMLSNKLERHTRIKYAVIMEAFIGDQDLYGAAPFYEDAPEGSIPEKPRRGPWMFVAAMRMGVVSVVIPAQRWTGSEGSWDATQWWVDTDIRTIADPVDIGGDYKNCNICTPTLGTSVTMSGPAPVVGAIDGLMGSVLYHIILIS
ncbi:hypothetical protein BD779DRAFT_1697263 [Infundibulicybe gibba]|nr:hypothetical protein BD779DRAFT_1697263 [Infundibulicybe gibba]